MKYLLILLTLSLTLVLSSCQQDVVTAEHKKDVDSVLSQKGWVVNETFDHSKETAYNHLKLVTATENLLWIADQITVYASTNGGITWNTALEVDNDSTVAIQLINDNMGFAAYAWYNGGIYETTDAGNTFGIISKKEYEGDGGTRAFCAINNQAFCYTSGGSIKFTNDNGTTWKDIKTPLQYNNTVYSFENSTFFVADWPGWSNKIYRYQMGSVYENIGSGMQFTSFWFLTPDKGWIADLKNVIVYTTDGGKLWYNGGDLNLPPVSSKIVKIKFIDDDNGWLIVQNDDNTSSIYASNDGGKNWTKQYQYDGGHLEDIWMVNKNLGYAVGYGIVLKTENGGWE